MNLKNVFDIGRNIHIYFSFYSIKMFPNILTVSKVSKNIDSFENEVTPLLHEALQLFYFKIS